jgi:hypothetical protein
VQPQIASFGCSVVKEACTAFVKPKTVKVSTSILYSYQNLAIDRLQSCGFRIPRTTMLMVRS